MKPTYAFRLLARDMIYSVIGKANQYIFLDNQYIMIKSEEKKRKTKKIKL